jgi:hypothetical protein
MDAYFQWLRDKRHTQAPPPASPGSADGPDHPDSPGQGLPDPARAFALIPTGNLGFFALFSPSFLPSYSLGSGITHSPSTLGHFCCCLSIL